MSGTQTSWNNIKVSIIRVANYTITLIIYLSLYLQLLRLRATCFKHKFAEFDFYRLWRTFNQEDICVNMSYRTSCFLSTTMDNICFDIADADDLISKHSTESVTIDQSSVSTLDGVTSVRFFVRCMHAETIWHRLATLRVSTQVGVSEHMQSYLTLMHVTIRSTEQMTSGSFHYPPAVFVCSLLCRIEIQQIKCQLFRMTSSLLQQSVHDTLTYRNFFSVTIHFVLHVGRQHKFYFLQIHNFNHQFRKSGSCFQK